MTSLKKIKAAAVNYFIISSFILKKNVHQFSDYCEINRKSLRHCRRSFQIIIMNFLFRLYYILLTVISSLSLIYLHLSFCLDFLLFKTCCTNVNDVNEQRRRLTEVDLLTSVTDCVVVVLLLCVSRVKRGSVIRVKWREKPRREEEETSREMK